MIISRLSGGMGNQMFQYAAGRALALKYNVPLALDVTFLHNQTTIPLIRPVFSKREYDLGVFRVAATIADSKDIPWYGKPFFSGILMQCIDAVLRKIPIIPGWEKRFSFNPNVFTLGPNVYLSGFWQSYKYFEHIADIIRSDFQLQQPLPENAEQLKQEIMSRNAVCVHVRRADYTAVNLHKTIGSEYFTDAFKIVQKKTAVDHVYVFSDDVAWCKENVHFDAPTTYVGNEYAGERASGHLILMSVCKHFIISNSTFGWWAAWLSVSKDKVVVAPQQWLAGSRLDTSDVCPPEWIRI